MRAVVVFVVALAAAACSSDPASPPAFDTGPGPGATRDAGSTGPGADVGTARRRARGERCCYLGVSYRCADEAACFGGVDLAACVSACAGSAECLTTTCTEALRHAPAPAGCAPAPVDPDFACE